MGLGMWNFVRNATSFGQPFGTAVVFGGIVFKLPEASRLLFGGPLAFSLTSQSAPSSFRPESGHDLFDILVDPTPNVSNNVVR